MFPYLYVCVLKKTEGDILYYVIQVAPGMEDRTEAFIRNKVPVELYHHCFHPLRHVRKKFHGEWKDIHEKLLPGYVFIVSDSVEVLYNELKQVPLLTKMLGKDGREFVALRESEVEWLERLLGAPEAEDCGGKGTDEPNGSRIDCRDGDSQFMEVGLSQVSVQDKIAILSGPLKNMEGKIRKINLHKRVAEVEVDFMAKKTIVYLGLEIVGNNDTE
ncbi:MAG: hypothetical protein HFG65_16840 [Hungatella sp.]|nr:hypothetical protein [Hungatella sp.]